MALTKFKAFKIPMNTSIHDFLNEGKEYEIINKFLADGNHIYINHTITILTEDTRENGQFKSVNIYLLITLVYNDLSATSLDLTKVSSKIKKVVTEMVKSDEIVKKPDIKTAFDRKINDGGAKEKREK